MREKNVRSVGQKKVRLAIMVPPSRLKAKTHLRKWCEHILVYFIEFSLVVDAITQCDDAIKLMCLELD